MGGAGVRGASLVAPVVKKKKKKTCLPTQKAYEMRV